MNREETKKAIEVMQAYVDGAEIENISADTGRSNYWLTGYPSWQWDGDSTTYRIKPKLREFWAGLDENGRAVGITPAINSGSIPSYWKTAIKVREVL